MGAGFRVLPGGGFAVCVLVCFVFGGLFLFAGVFGRVLQDKNLRVDTISGQGSARGRPGR